MPKGVNALSGLYIISTESKLFGKVPVYLVSMPSRAYTSFLQEDLLWKRDSVNVSMPSRAYTSFLLRKISLYG